MEKKGLLLIAAVFGVELAGIKRRIEVAGIRVGVAIDRGPRPVQALLNLLDHDQRFLRGSTRFG
jgi:hypothetical protein